MKINQKKIKRILKVNTNYLCSFDRKLEKLNVMRFKKLQVRFWIRLRTQVSVHKFHPIKIKFHLNNSNMLVYGKGFHFKREFKKEKKMFHPNNKQVISC